MGRTTFVRRGDRVFWTWDDSLGVWAAYVAEEIDRLDDPPADLARLAENLHVVAAAIDFGADFTDLSQESFAVLHELSRAPGNAPWRAAR